MERVSLEYAESRLGDLLDRVAGGEQIEITRDGAPVARLSGLHSGRSAVENARRLRDAISDRGESFTWEELRSWRDQGRS